MYIQLVSIHGLIRGTNIEMGRDADTGGQVRYVLELAKTLSTFDEIDQVDLFTRQIKDKRVSSDYSQPIEQLNDKARIVRLPCGGGRYIRKEKLWPYLDDYVDAMVTFTRKEKRTPAVIHGHYADAGYIAREVAAMFGVPFVFTGHSLGRDKLAYLREEGMSDDAINRDFNMDQRIRVEEACLAAADAVVASTRHERDTQYGRYHNGKEPRFAVIPPGTELDRFFPYYEYELNPDSIDPGYKQARMGMIHELERFHFQTDKPFILALCRPDKRKNINALIQAYGEDKELQHLANLAVFAGIRKRISEMEQAEQEVLTEMLLLMDRYDLYGRLAIPKRHESEKEVPELYRYAAAQRGVFCNPAFVEPFGLTFIESSAVGLPFVGTHNGGPQDIKENCESGLLVDVTDPGELAKALKKLLTDEELWNTLSNNGVNRVREHYTWEVHCETYLSVLKELTKEPGKTVAIQKAETIPHAQRLAELDCLVICDIDTTLIGDPEALENLRELLEENRGRVGFGVATGRYLESAQDALKEHGIERTDLMITSVGTEIYYGPNRDPDKGWASHLRAKWKPERVREALSPLKFISLQQDEATQREFKISYDLDSDVPAEEAIPQIHEALFWARVPYSLVFSHNAYIDILPQRASKGKAIRYMADKYNIPMETIATSGDSGNDMDMLKGRTAAIVPAEHEPELDELKNSGTRVYFAEGSYAAAIIEGLAHYGLIDAKVGK